MLDMLSDTPAVKSLCTSISFLAAADLLLRVFSSHFLSYSLANGMSANAALFINNFPCLLFQLNSYKCRKFDK